MLADKLSATTAGKVLKGTESEVYLDLGQRDGILPGNRFEVVRPGLPLKVGDQVIGYEETFIAEVEVSKVRGNVSICTVIKKNAVPKEGDNAYQMRQRINTLVVGQFSSNSGINALTKSLQEKLVTAMTNRGMKVVERDQLERVLREQKLGYSGLIDMDSAQKIGELLGAEGMVLGTVTDLGNSIAINARLVDIKSGNAVAASEVELSKNPQIDQLFQTKIAYDPTLAAGIGLTVGSQRPNTTVSPAFSQPSQHDKKSFTSVQNGPLRAYARSVNKSDDKQGLSVTVMVENTSDKDIFLAQEYCGGANMDPFALDTNQGARFWGKASGLPIVCRTEKNHFKNYSAISPNGSIALSFSATTKQAIKSNTFSVTMVFLMHKGKEEDGKGDSYSSISLGLLDIPCMNNCQ